MPRARFAIIVYKNEPEAARLAERTEDILREAGVTARLETSGPGRWRAAPAGFKPDLIISLGGDGTLLYAARIWGLGGAPLLGVNMGHLGFLAETEPEYYEELLQAAIQGHCRVQTRFTLDVTIEREGRILETVTVLNDAVINKSALARIMRIRVSVEGFGSWHYQADGLILATPTGSTAYNLSAGGPVVHPSLPAVILTAICPFTLSSRPLIIPDHLTIEVALDLKAVDAHLSGDGQVSLALCPGDRLIVRRSASEIKLVVNPHHRFSDSLRQKLGWC